jgi:hypothetical protein
MGKYTQPRIEPTAEALDETGWVRGTDCEKKVVAILQAAGVDVLPKKMLCDLLAAEGAHKTTILRTLDGLRKKGNIETGKRIGRESYIKLINPELRWVRRVFDKREVKSNRFGACELEANARYVRTFLSDRLDNLFESPNAYLAHVLRAVELAGRIAEAAMMGRTAALADAVAEYKREWIDPEPNQWRRPLDSARLFEALSVGLFAEEFEGDPEVKERLDTHYKTMAEERRRIVAETNSENERRRAVGEPLIELDVSRFATVPKDEIRGLVPVGGGARVGLMRLRAFLETVGAKAEADDLTERERLPRSRPAA